MILSVDLGSSSCKVLVFRQDGEQVFGVREKLPVHAPRDGYAEHRVSDWRRALKRNLKKIEEDPGLSGIDRIAVTGLGGAFFPVDSSGESISPPVLAYMDRRSGELEQDFSGLKGGRRMLCQNYSWLRQNFSGALEEAEYMIDARDYVFYLFTGEFRRNSFDFPDGDLERLCEEHGMRSSLFPRSIDFTERTMAEGEIGSEFGLQDARVVSCPWDEICAAIGCGLTGEGDTAVDFGTTRKISVLKPGEDANKDFYYDGLGLRSFYAPSPFQDSMPGREKVREEAVSMKTKLDEVGAGEKITAGGGESVENWNRIRAGVFGRKVREPENLDTAAMGSAVLAASSQRSQVRDKTKEMVGFRKVYGPGEREDLPSGEPDIQLEWDS